MSFKQRQLNARHTDIVSASEAWIDVALTGLLLYIPNYPHDPALLPMIERKFFNQERASLWQKLEDLQRFQLGFTGQSTTLRIRQLQKRIEQMGAEPPVPAVVRPDVSELDALQGYFGNLSSILKPLMEKKMSAQEAAHDNTLRQNVYHTIERLATDFRAYDDITGPAVGFLVCLSIGLSLGTLVQSKDDAVVSSLKYITQHTPLFGLSERIVIPTSMTIVEDFEDFVQEGAKPVDIRWHSLHSLVAIREIDNPQMSTPLMRRLVQNIFASLYSEWKETLLKDQENEAKNSSLYTYKGDEENTEEADLSLFPDYEQEEEKQTSPSSTTREHAIRVANIHADLLLGGRDASESLQDLLRWCAAEMVRASNGKAHGTLSESAFPAIFLALEKKSQALSASGAGRSYNFYFDANLPEAKKMMLLIHRIQQRYRQIRRVWPEHATLSDVLQTCDEALSFRHVDPVAKLLTKLEKLHAYIYEWQRVASREYSTANLYDDLTSLLVSWRQLELTTWARLFDLEAEKCKDDAKSWFFVAYEIIIAASESIQSGRDMRIHAKSLLKNLESFFSTTTLGQFGRRIVLLTQLREHVKLRKHDEPLFEHIYLALDNFISYFSRLQKPVDDALTKGRQVLEKEVNNVIKLASWKDTNIDALKQSAKTSHRKLTKLVRKFRALVNQPVSGIYSAGFSEHNFTAPEVVLATASVEVDSEVNNVCERQITGWTERPTRFKNLAATTSIMRSKASPPSDIIDGATYIESFIVDLETSITQLQKATPSVLNDDNKETVQHLKTRKRKLYADTMKELRQMGIRSNLSSDILIKQDELSSILTSLPKIQGTGSVVASGADYFLHKSLSIMDQVRAVSKEHSGDLTGNDVTKSIGYLEGLLHMAIRQRGQLSTGLQPLEEMKSPLSQVDNLCNADNNSITRTHAGKIAQTASLVAAMSWLSTMLKTCAKIVGAQAKLGKTNGFVAVTDGLENWSLQFTNLVDTYNHLPSLPPNLWSSAQTDFYELAMEKLSRLQTDFRAWYELHDQPRPILKQIQQYIFNLPSIAAESIPDVDQGDVTNLSHQVLGVLDLILGAMQDLEGTLKNLPASTDDSIWLEKEQEVMVTAMSSLHAPQITKTLGAVINKIHLIGQKEDLKTSAALFSTIQPILTQYFSVHEFIVAKFESLHLSTTKLLYRLARTFSTLR